MEIENIENLKKSVENMNKYHQVEILKILSKNLCKLNENKSGVYVNLSLLSKDVLNEIKEYVDYIKEQEECLNTMEYQKNEFKNAFFIDKDNKEEITNTYNVLEIPTK